MRISFGPEIYTNAFEATLRFYQDCLDFKQADDTYGFENMEGFAVLVHKEDPHCILYVCVADSPNVDRLFRPAFHGGELVQIKPDAYVRLGRAAIEYSAFIEVDLSTETLPTILKKSQRYVDYWRSGMEQQRRDVFPKVVWLVKTEHRRERIVGEVGKLALDGQVLFAVGLLGDGPQLVGGAELESGCASTAPPAPRLLRSWPNSREPMIRAYLLRIRRGYSAPTSTTGSGKSFSRTAALAPMNGTRQ